MLQITIHERLHAFLDSRRNSKKRLFRFSDFTSLRFPAGIKTLKSKRPNVNILLVKRYPRKLVLSHLVPKSFFQPPGLSSGREVAKNVFDRNFLMRILKSWCRSSNITMIILGFSIPSRSGSQKGVVL